MKIELDVEAIATAYDSPTGSLENVRKAGPFVKVTVTSSTVDGPMVLYADTIPMALRRLAQVLEWMSPPVIAVEK